MNRSTGTRVRNSLKAGRIVSAVVLAVACTQAVAGYCQSGTASPRLSVNDMTYGVNPDAAITAATDCYGVLSGNDSKGINGLNLTWGNDWVLAAKDNTDSNNDEANTVLGIAFEADAGGKTASGHWALSGSAISLPTHSIYLDIVGVLKSSTEYALYFFDNVAFDGAGGGIWLSPGVNKKGSPQALSHLSIYVREGEAPLGTSTPFGGEMAAPAGEMASPAGDMASPTGGGGAVDGAGGSIPPGSSSDSSAGTPGTGTTTNPTAVPEPGSLALQGAALALLALVRRCSAKRANGAGHQAEILRQ